MIDIIENALPGVPLRRRSASVAAGNSTPASARDLAVRGGPGGASVPAGAAAPRPPGSWAARVRGWVVPLVPALAELLVGGYRLGGPSLWRDEGYTVEVASRPVSRIVAMLGHQDAVHGVYYLGMHYVIAALGTSAAALRLPSLLAASAAAALTAVLGRRVGRAAAAPAPALLGLLAGLLLVAVPLTTWYAQDARPYALAMLCAVAASYLFVRGVAERRWRWWAGYAVAVVALGVFNLLALLLVAAHGITLLAWRGRRGRPGGSARPDGQTGSDALAPGGLLSCASDVPVPSAGPAVGGQAGGAGPVPGGPAASVRWAVAAAAALLALTPLLVISYSQIGQIGWVRKPDLRVVTGLVAGFAGTRDLVPVVAALALTGVVAELRRPAHSAPHPGGTGPLAALALPWLVLPPVALLGYSLLAFPVYVERYVIFCLPALSLLTAAGLAWLARLARDGLARLARDWLAARATLAGRLAPGLAALPSAAVLAGMVVLLIGPQQSIRLNSHRPDDLRAVAAVVAAQERPGDAVLYLPWSTRVVGLTYPGPFLRLRDIGLRESPSASATLTGREVRGTVLTARAATVRRLWVVRWRGGRWLRHHTPMQRAEAALIGRLRLARTWAVGSVVLSLYTAAGSG